MRPLDLGQTIDAAMKIAQRRWRTLAVLVLVVAGPLQVASVVITAATIDHWSLNGFIGPTDVTYSDENAYVLGQTAILALTALSYLLGTVACYRVVADDYLGRATSAGASLAFALERLGGTLWLSILLVLGLVAALLAFILPGIWLGVAWSVAVPVMLVEGVGGTRALRRSFDLTRERWWATAGRLIVAAIMAWVATSAFTLAAGALAKALVDESSVVALAFLHAGSLAASVLTTPFLAAVTVLIYFDLRVRKERFDPRGALDGAPGTPAAPEESFGGFLPPSAS